MHQHTPKKRMVLVWKKEGRNHLMVGDEFEFEFEYEYEYGKAVAESWVVSTVERERFIFVSRYCDSAHNSSQVFE